MKPERMSPEGRKNIIVPGSTTDIENRRYVLETLATDITELKEYLQEARAVVDRARETGDTARVALAEQAMHKAAEILKANEEAYAKLSLSVESALN